MTRERFPDHEQSLDLLDLDEDEIGGPSLLPGQRNLAQQGPSSQRIARRQPGKGRSSLQVYGACGAQRMELPFTVPRPAEIGREVDSDSPAGRRSLGHEAVDTIQQSGAPAAQPQPELEVPRPGDALEVEADGAVEAQE